MADLVQIQAHLQAQDARRRWLAAGDRLAAAVAAAAILLLLFVALDNTVWLSGAVATLFSAGMGFLLAGGAVWAAVAWLRRESAAATARRLEAAAPAGDLPSNALINPVLMAAGAPAESAWASHLAADVDADRLRRVRLPPPPGLRRNGLLLAAAGGVLALLAVLTPGATSASLYRIFHPGSIPPGAGRIVLKQVLPGNTLARSGDTVAVVADVWGELEARGRADSPVVLEIRGANRGGQRLPMSFRKTETEPAGTVPLYRCEGRVAQVFQDCEYRVWAGRDRSNWFSVRLATPPQLLDWEAAVTLPAYLGGGEKRLRKNDAKPGGEVPAGSAVSLRGRGDQPLKAAGIRMGAATVPVRSAVCREKEFSVDFTPAGGGTPFLFLTGVTDVGSTQPLPWVVVPDAPPFVSLAETPLRLKVAPLAQVNVGFEAKDDHGVAAAGLELAGGAGKGWKTLQRRNAEGKTGTATFQGRFVLPASELGLQPGQRVSLRVFAQDGRPEAELFRGYSPIVEVTLEEPQEQTADRRKAEAAAQASLAALVKLQQENIQGTERLLATARRGAPLANTPIVALQAAQQRILGQARELLKTPDGLGELALQLAALEKADMPEAVKRLEEASAAAVSQRPLRLDLSLPVQQRILARLTGLKEGSAQEAVHESRRDLFTLYRQLCAGQQKNLEGSEALAKATGTAPAGTPPAALAKAEDLLAAQLTVFLELSANAVMTEAQAPEDGFAEVVKQVRELLQTQKVYESMVLAAESLDAGKLDAAVPREKDILKTLLRGLDLLNRWNVKNAKELVAKADGKLQELAAALADLEKQQKGIVEATRELGRQGKMDAGVREKLKEMDKQQEAMAELVEKLANDLFQFPDLPVSNEIKGKMREIYEDVQQAMNSANEPAVEVAVQKEDALLDAIRNTKERVQDVEMWLPDVPDNIVWNMEAFDADEFPNMPLVPLPDELEDIVGDLLDQAKDIEEKSQDSTGNNMMADAEMGWAVMDGPMPNFSAKGKSGNARPNDNEMTGRSGAGREGQSNGEVVEGQVKGLEGRETKARYTKDALQAGKVEESEDSKLDARSTGGGKLGGVSESVGLFGQAPRRDLGLGDHSENATPLRREVEAAYTKARLLYLESGGLAQAAQGLREMEASKAQYGSLSRKVVKHLQGSQVELAAGAALPMASESSSAATEGRNVWEAGLDQIQDESYREMIKAFYQKVGGAASPPP